MSKSEMCSTRLRGLYFFLGRLGFLGRRPKDPKYYTFLGRCLS